MNRRVEYEKRTYGQFATTINPFNHRAFLTWCSRAGLPAELMLEPFAGTNSIINHLKNIRKVKRWVSYDIEPKADGVIQRDTISNFPVGYRVCVTNPPWLAKNSATFRKLSFPQTQYDNLYKLALAKCLNNCEYVAVLVPESFIRAKLFQRRLHAFVSLTKIIFNDTQHPVGLALFVPFPVNDTIIYSGEQRIGLLSKLQRQRPPSFNFPGIRFNSLNGNLGLIALDNTKEASIRFCRVEELRDYKVKDTCRHITKITVPWKVNIKDCNESIRLFRETTKDVFLTCYRGLRKDGMYRRRLDWKLARDIICNEKKKEVKDGS